MCFTININTTRDAIEKRFSVDGSVLFDFEYRFFYRAFDNPMIPVVTQQDPGEVKLMKWGLIPGWARDREHAEKIRKGTYNARSETIEEKASFKNTLAAQRCWIIASGFFEWQLVGKERIPWYIHLSESSLFAFAGVYDRWTDPVTGIPEYTFSIITTKANALMSKIHNTKERMPVILKPNLEKHWIAPDLNRDMSKEIFHSVSENKMKAFTIKNEISRRDANPFDKTIIEPFNYHKNGTLF